MKQESECIGQNPKEKYLSPRMSVIKVIPRKIVCYSDIGGNGISDMQRDNTDNPFIL